MKYKFTQDKDHSPSGNPVNNHILEVDVDDARALFVCATVPGDFDIVGIFKCANLHPQQGQQGQCDTITIPRHEFSRAVNALLAAENSGESKHHPPQKELLLTLQKMFPFN